MSGHRKEEKSEPLVPLYQLQSLPKDIYEQLEKIHINLGNKYFHVGASLPTSKKVELIFFLVSNLDVFVWSPYEALKVDPNFICHWLNVDPRCSPKKQRPRRSLDVHAGAVKEKVDKFKEAGAIKEVFYPE